MKKNTGVCRSALRQRLRISLATSFSRTPNTGKRCVLDIGLRIRFKWVFKCQPRFQAEFIWTYLYSQENKIKGKKKEEKKDQVLFFFFKSSGKQTKANLSMATSNKSIHWGLLSISPSCCLQQSNRGQGLFFMVKKKRGGGKYGTENKWSIKENNL